MRVDISEFEKMLNYRNEINKCDLSEIEVYGKDGKKIEITNEMIDEWRFIGLNNTDFIKEHFINKRN